MKWIRRDIRIGGLWFDGRNAWVSWNWLGMRHCVYNLPFLRSGGRMSHFSWTTTGSTGQSPTH